MMHPNEATQSMPESPGGSLNMLRDLMSRRNVSVPRKVDKPLVLYGAGDLGQMARSYFNALGIAFLYVVDAQADRYLNHPAWVGISVIKPEEVPEEHRSEYILAVCIATSSYSSVSTALADQGWLDVVPFYDITEAYTDRYPLYNGWFGGELEARDREEITHAFQQWADDASRAYYLQFLAWHLIRAELIFTDAPVNTQNRYFIPEITGVLHEKEIFLDGGAHEGSASFRFMDIVNHQFQKIYAIEPDRKNSQVFTEKLKSRQTDAFQRIELLDCALGKNSGAFHFHAGLGYGSQLGLQGNDSVMVKTIDELDIPATFVKLHLEGWEYDALSGGLQNICKYRPLLAVTTYHNRNGLWRVSSLLMKNLVDYVFLFRLHAWMGTGSVLYALPKERLGAI